MASTLCQDLTAQSDKTIRVWDADTGNVVSGPFTGHTNWVRISVAFSQDGKHIVSGSDKTIRVWDADTGNVVSGPFNHTHSVNSVAFSQDGKIVSGSDDKTIWVWDATLAMLFQGHSQVTPTQSTLLHSHRMASTLCQDLMTRQSGCGMQTLAMLFQGHSQVTPTGSTLLHSHRMASTLCQDLMTTQSGCGMQTLAMLFQGHSQVTHTVGCWVNSVAFSQDGKHIVSGSSDNTIRVWDADTGNVVSGHTNSVHSQVTPQSCVRHSVAGPFSQDGKDGKHCVRI
jgi:WD40 repeat protein